MGSGPKERKALIIVLASALFLLLAGISVLNAFNPKLLPKFLVPASADQILAFTSISTVAILLFMLVLVLLVRNVLKLYADQRNRVLGSRLRTRMLWGAVLVSVLPIAFMFFFGYGLLNRSFERWFSQPVTEMFDDSNWMALELSRYAAANARVEATDIARELTPPAAQSSGVMIDHILRTHDATLQGGFAIVYRDEKPVATFHAPATSEPASLKSWTPGTPATPDAQQAADASLDGQESTAASVGLTEARSAIHGPVYTAILTASQRQDDTLFSLGDTDYALGEARVVSGSTIIVVGLPMPNGLSKTMASMHSHVDEYWKLFRGRRELRRAYMLVLLMITLLALFAATWMALHFSKQVTKPVEEIADAMAAVAAGDYGRRVDQTSTEEMGELIQSFNRMAADLENSRRQIETSTLQISAQNATLERRRSELETMLQTIPNGVVTLTTERRLVLVNRALTEMLDPGGQRTFSGQDVEHVFPPELTEVLDRLILRSHRMGTASAEADIAGIDGPRNLAVTVALLESGTGASRKQRGYVVVLEDATELLRAQKQSAWKEVARRVAHEIKNPLTPISLSAEQIRRHIDRIAAWHATLELESASTAVIRRSSEVITASVENMRQLVNQFGALAEFPSAQPRPASLHEIVAASMHLFAGRLEGIRVVTALANDLPPVMADPEALKRALSNLIDNAAEAMQKSLHKELRISTALLPSGMIELAIADTGSGLTDDMRERLFLPYFSTKQRGTGLGLAIAAKIIQEHGGTIRAERNVPAGALFIVELRSASSGDLDQTASDSNTSAAQSSLTSEVR